MLALSSEMPTGIDRSSVLLYSPLKPERKRQIELSFTPLHTSTPIHTLTCRLLHTLALISFHTYATPHTHPPTHTNTRIQSRIKHTLQNCYYKCSRTKSWFLASHAHFLSFHRQHVHPCTLGIMFTASLMHENTASLI